jgi:ABC-type antimicrobial peptide transport system permease subunit
VILATGSSFAAKNTLYAAGGAAGARIGAVRVPGFSRFSILSGFPLESVLLSALASLLGCLLVIPLDGVTTAVGGSNFSDPAFDFQVTPAIMLAGIAFAAPF